MSFDVRAENANLMITMVLIIKAIFLAKPNLQQIIIKRLFGYPYILRRVFQVLLNNITVFVRLAVVQVTPVAHLIHDEPYLPLLGAAAYLLLLLRPGASPRQMDWRRDIRENRLPALQYNPLLVNLGERDNEILTNGIITRVHKNLFLC
jgi:hypothetical protein